VIQKIEDYIFYIHPTITVYIAFDGVAPFAKMDQQRTRRHKTVLLPNNSSTSTWSTSNITPGTRFMERLSQSIHDAFHKKEQKYQVQTLIVSTSTDPGEGEHKLFEHMRERSVSKNTKYNTKNEVCAIYGLDSDLIMLAIFHCRLFKNLYIFREETEFMKTAISLPKPKQNPSSMFCYFMDIDALGKGIVKEMKCQFSDEKRIYDYVFLCFFLGNDFLPHFPALNIRTHGIDILLETYRRIVGQYPDRFFIEDNLEIQWKWVKKCVQDLAEKEHNYLLIEYQTRNKWNKYSWKTDTDENRDIVLQSVPVIYRADEHYIFPTEKGWQQRYYKCLFNEDKTTIQQICNNFSNA
jgi:5'-3' exonuclease